jgi:hypothetical protein
MKYLLPLLLLYGSLSLCGQTILQSASLRGYASLSPPVSGGAPAGPSYAGPTWVTNGVFPLKPQ